MGQLLVRIRIALEDRQCLLAVLDLTLSLTLTLRSPSGSARLARLFRLPRLAARSAFAASRFSWEISIRESNKTKKKVPPFPKKLDFGGTFAMERPSTRPSNNTKTLPSGIPAGQQQY